MKIKLYIVSGRVDTSVIIPRIFKTKWEAEIEMQDIIYEAAKQCYEWNEDDPVEDLDYDILCEWAEENGYEFGYEEDYGSFYDGNEYTEAMITEKEIDI